ncbi:MAG: Endoribonuclease YbeY [Candidatus Parcubacteria bacterium]|jgi:rRNA maturation RNase YbeY
MKKKQIGTRKTGPVAYEQSLALLEKTAKRVVSFLRKKNSTVAVWLLSDAHMRRWERKYMHKEKKIVNVLSFKNPDEFPRPEERKKVLGDVLINWSLYKNDVPYMQYLLVHGILHIVGYRHGRKHDRIKMQNLELRVCHHISLPESISEQIRLKRSSLSARTLAK